MKENSFVSRPQHLISILSIAILSVALYANTLKNGFVYDDKDVIIGKSFIRDIHNLPNLFTQNYFNLSGEMSFRPVVTFSYFLDYAVFGLKPWGYHLTNTLLHTFNGILLYILLVLLIHPIMNQASWLSLLDNKPLLISFLFVSNPILTEAVNVISYREDLLVFSFYIATLISYVILRARPHLSLSFAIPIYLFSCFCLFIALFSKEMAITLPLVVFCYECIYAKKKNENPWSTLFNYYNIGYVIIIMVYSYIRFYYLYDLRTYHIPISPLYERLHNAPWLLVNYLKLIIFPVSLSADYEIVPLNSFFSLSVIFSSIVVIFILFVALIMRKKEKGITLGFLIFCIMIVPVCNLIPIANPFAERYLYLPSLGIVIVVGSTIYLINKNLTHTPKFKSLSILLPFLFILSIYSTVTVKRNNIWHDDYKLWHDTIKKVPNSSRSHYNLGLAYAAQSKLEEAISHYQNAIRLNPDHLESLLELGAIYNDRGWVDEAIELYQYALNLKPNDPLFYYDFGILYARQGYLDRAVQLFQFALRLNPRFVEARYELGLIYLRKNMMSNARKEFEEVLRIMPTFRNAQHALESLDKKSP